MATSLYDGKQCVQLTPKAEAELKAMRRAVMDKRYRGEITSDEARAMLAATNKAFFRREVFEEVDELTTRNVRVTCQDCAREHIMPQSTLTYKCPCNPHLERNAFFGRERPV